MGLDNEQWLWMLEWMIIWLGTKRFEDGVTQCCGQVIWDSGRHF
jgi:hypothetical protein